MQWLKVKVLEGGTLPTKGTKGSAAVDLYAPKDVLIHANSRECVKLGIALEIPTGHAGVISHRSGHNKQFGLQAYGLIDSDYRGELAVTLVNPSPFAVKLKGGTRIAQLTLIELPSVVVKRVDTLSETERGEGGHGSTGE